MSGYIDEIAKAIYCLSEEGEPSESDLRLHRIYAVLALAVGEDVTNRMVHDAWSAWMTGERPDHRSLIPFHQLSPEVQEFDTIYRDAIRAVGSRFENGEWRLASGAPGPAGEAGGG